MANAMGLSSLLAACGSWRVHVRLKEASLASTLASTIRFAYRKYVWSVRQANRSVSSLSRKRFGWRATPTSTWWK